MFFDEHCATWSRSSREPANVDQRARQQQQQQQQQHREALPDANRVKTHIRYLYHELAALAAFVEANTLCVIKLCREFQSATDGLVVTDALDEQRLLPEPDEAQETARLEACSGVIAATRHELESFFSSQFYGGDLRLAQKAIAFRVPSPSQASRSGNSRPSLP
jgi:hypothetical protein